VLAYKLQFIFCQFLNAKKSHRILLEGPHSHNVADYCNIETTRRSAPSPYIVRARRPPSALRRHLPIRVLATPEHSNALQRPLLVY